MTHKICNHCRISKPLDAFNRHRGKPDGRNGRCRDCCKAFWHQYRSTLTRSGPRGGRAPYLLGADRGLDYAANQRRWAEKAVGVNFGGR